MIATLNKTWGKIQNALVSSVSVLALCLCVASIIFAGELSIYLPLGVGLSIITSIITLYLMAYRGSYPYTIGSVAIIPAALCGVLAQSMFASMKANGSINLMVSGLPTIVFSIALTTIITGIIFVLSGKQKLSILIRFVPYPVMGGFLAGVGGIISLGALNIMRRTPLLTEESFSYIFNLPTLIYLLPGILFGVTLLYFYRQKENADVFPLILVFSLLLFYLCTLVSGYSLEDISSHGWIFPSFTKADMWESASVYSLFNIHLPTVIRYIPEILVIVLVSSISFLITGTGIERLVQTDLDLDNDLVVTGAGNILSGLFGGFIGYHSIFFTKVNANLGATSRMPGILSALIVSFALFFGSSFVVLLFPKPIVGGILLFYGLNLIYEWLLSSYRLLNRLDYSLLVLIMSAILWKGVLFGILAGLLASSFLFVVSYQRVDVIQHILSGKSRRSNVERGLDEQNYLTEHGDSTLVFVLRGYLFFGTSYKLFNTIRDELSKRNDHFPKFLVLDFKYVSGIDSSVSHSFSKIVRLCHEINCQFVISSIDGDLFDHLDQTNCFEYAFLEHRAIFDTLDLALEWAEDELISLDTEHQFNKPKTIKELLSIWLENELTAEKLLRYMTKQHVREKEFVFRQDDPGDSLFILEQGQGSIYLELPDGDLKRLAKIKHGAVVGEMGLYREAPRTAAFRTDTSCVFYELTHESLVKMKREDPGLCTEFDDFIIHRLSDRISHANKLIAAL
jgi:SulP family sulfate permease